MSTVKIKGNIFDESLLALAPDSAEKSVQKNGANQKRIDQTKYVLDVISRLASEKNLDEQRLQRTVNEIACFRIGISIERINQSSLPDRVRFDHARAMLLERDADILSELAKTSLSPQKLNDAYAQMKAVKDREGLTMVPDEVYEAQYLLRARTVSRSISYELDDDARKILEIRDSDPQKDLNGALDTSPIIKELADVIKYGPLKAADELLRAVHVNSVDGDMYKLLTSVALARPSQDTPECLEYVHNQIKQAGLEPQETINRWLDNDKDEIFIGKNLDAIAQVEKASPGGAKYLHERYGITLFGRYDPKLLADIVRMDEDIAKGRMAPPKHPGMMIMPKTDYNGAFIRYDFPKELVLKHGCRIYEVGTTDDFRKTLANQAERFGRQEYLIVCGHGTAQSIQLGEPKGKPTGKYFLWSQNVMGAGEYGIKEHLVENPRIILISCKTGLSMARAEQLSGMGRPVDGVKRGELAYPPIAVSMSLTYNAMVSAPERSTNIKTLDASEGEHALVLLAEFYDDAETTFLAGRSIPQLGRNAAKGLDEVYTVKP
jgi:hypothetical protein